MGNLLWMMMELLIYSGLSWMAARMTDDWQHLTGDTVVMSTARQGYSEGPVMFKRKGIYYYIYTLRGIRIM